MNTTDQTITVNKYRYFVREMGVGPPLLLLHGFTGRVENWRHIQPALAADYRVIAVDLPGHGRTTAPGHPDRYAMAAVTADLTAILHALDASPAHLLGYSMGGRLALHTAVHAPGHVRRLVLESASPGLETAAERAERRGRDKALADRIEEEGIRPFVDFWEGLALWDSQRQLDPAVRADLRALRLRNRPWGLANSLRGMGTGVQPSLWGELTRVDCPVLLLTGALDGKFKHIAQQMAVLLPQATHHSVAGAGHTVHLERPHAFKLAIRQFLGSSTPATTLR